eukprot:6100269-Amphidinium_carterae.1
MMRMVHEVPSEPKVGFQAYVPESQPSGSDVWLEGRKKGLQAYVPESLPPDLDYVTYWNPIEKGLVLVYVVHQS